MPKKVWSKEKVISELRRHRQDGPKMHPQLDDAARRHFGSLRAALKVAGLPCGKRPPPYESWTRDSVIEAIRERKRNGRSLRRARREASTLYSAENDCLVTGQPPAPLLDILGHRGTTTLPTKCACESLTFTSVSCH